MNDFIKSFRRTSLTIKEPNEKKSDQQREPQTVDHHHQQRDDEEEEEWEEEGHNNQLNEKQTHGIGEEEDPIQHFLKEIGEKKRSLEDREQKSIQKMIESVLDALVANAKKKDRVKVYINLILGIEDLRTEDQENLRQEYKKVLENNGSISPVVHLIKTGDIIERLYKGNFSPQDKTDLNVRTFIATLESDLIAEPNKQVADMNEFLWAAYILKSIDVYGENEKNNEILRQLKLYMETKVKESAEKKTNNKK